jgi:hypothetical protein
VKTAEERLPAAAHVAPRTGLGESGGGDVACWFTAHLNQIRPLFSLADSFLARNEIKRFRQNTRLIAQTKPHCGFDSPRLLPKFLSDEQRNRHALQRFAAASPAQAA